MNQSAQPGAGTATPSVATVEEPRRPQERAATKALASVWATTTRPGLLSDSRALIRPASLALAAPPVLCAIALLAAQRVAVDWLVAFFTLAASLLALAGIGALASALRDPTVAAMDGVEDDEWSPLRPEAPTRAAEQVMQAGANTVAQRRLAMRLGFTLLALAAICALPVGLTGSLAAGLAAGLAVVALALYSVDVVRQRIAPLDEIITPLALGPGLVSLTIVAQGQRMNLWDWLVAAALGAMAFALLEGRRLREVGALDAEQVHAQRTLATLIGPRAATTLIAFALLASYALMLGLALPLDGWPGALLALISLPTALVGLSGLAVSHYAPARRTAARRLAWAYLWFGLALTAGLALTLVAQNIINAITVALGS